MLRFPLWSLALWAIGFAFELAILFTAYRRKALPGLWSLHLLISVTVAADVARACILLAGGSGDLYAWAWWTANALEMLLRSVIAFQILCYVLRKHLRHVVMAGVYAAVWLGWVFVEHFRGDPVSLLTVASTANFISLALAAAAILIPSGDWPRGWSAVVFGVFAASGLDMALALIQRNMGVTSSLVFVALWQCTPLVSLWLWFAAVRDGHTAPKAQRVGA